MKIKNNHSTWLVLLAVFNALLGSAIVCYNYPFSAPTSLAALLFFGLALLSQLLLMSLALTLLPFLLQRVFGLEWLSRLVAVLSFALGLALIVTDAKVFELYRFHLNAMVMNLLFGGALQDNLSFSLSLWLIIFAVVLLIFGSQAFLVWRFDRVQKQSTWFSLRRCWLIALIMFLSANLMHGWYEAKANTNVVAQARYVPWFQALTMRSSLKKLGVEVKTRDSSANLMSESHSALHYPKAPLQCSAAQPLNIIILMVDSMRFDMLQAQTMPTVTAFAQNALRFDRHYSTGNATRYGVFGFFYGLPANYWSAMLAEERGSVFMDQMKVQRYQMHLLASATLSNPEFDRTAFANVREAITVSPRQATIAERDQWVTQQMLERLDAIDGKQPFFSFAFYDAPHGFGLPEGFVSPFQPMVENVNYLTLGPDSDRDAFFNRYKASVLFVDQQIQKVLAKITDKDLWKNSVVLITSDHGQEFNDLGKNFWGHNNNYADYQVKVPLLIRWPDKPAFTEAQLTSHEDIVPTLMTHVLGCSNPLSDYSTGVDLFSPRANRVLSVESWSDRAVLSGDRIYQYNNLGQTDVFDKHYNVVDESPEPKAVTEVLARMTAFFH